MVLQQIYEFLNQNQNQNVQENDPEYLPEEGLPIANFPAAVLFVDISGKDLIDQISFLLLLLMGSGFTALNEKYARQEGGIEIVTKHINGYFAKLITLIESQGGDVLKVRNNL